MRLLATALLLIVVIGVDCEDEEVLPTPEAQRMGYKNINHAYQQNLKMASTNKFSKMDDFDADYDRLGMDVSQSGYGDYGSDSGYGLSCASGYVNASAVALLAFLFLLNIVQDVIQQITGNRKKRSLEGEEEDDYLSGVMQFLSDGGLDAMKEGVPEILLKLLIRLSSAHNAECQQRPICETNKELSEKFGTVGHVVGVLSSNVLAKAFSGAHSNHFILAQKAAITGRELGNCEAYIDCRANWRKKRDNGQKNDAREEENI